MATQVRAEALDTAQHDFERREQRQIADVVVFVFEANLWFTCLNSVYSFQ